MKRAFAGAGLFFVLACTVGACVGDDPNPTTPERQPDPNIAVGREGGACTEDKKCIEGLECVRGAICLPPEDGGATQTDAGGGGDGSTSDATASTDADSGPLICAYSGNPSAGEVACGNVYCPANQITKCCLQAQGTPNCQNPCNAKPLACDAPEDCSGSRCCLAVNLTITAAQACASGVDWSLLSDTHCGACDGTNEYRICSTDADCADLTGAPSCRKVDVKNNGFAKTFGVCL